MKATKNNIKGSIILGVAALIWGLAFVAQSKAAEYLPPFTVNMFRSLIAAMVLYLLVKIMDKGKTTFFPQEKKERGMFYAGGIACGIMLAIATNFQQFGIDVYPKGVASEARAGFITALYVILVPIISSVFGKRISVFVWIGVIVATVGVYLLCFSGGFGGIYLGDVLVLICAVAFSVHIIAVDKYVGITGGIKLSCMQFFVAGIVSLILVFIFEIKSLTYDVAINAMPYILYLAIMSSGVAYTLQIVGQKYAEPAVASISMSLESVFAALGGWVISGNMLKSREILGCAFVFAAIIIAQAKDFKKKA